MITGAPMNLGPSINDVPALRDAIRRWELGSLVVGCVALAVCIAGAFLGHSGQFFRAYFSAYLFFLGIGLGGMAILMLSHLTGGAWAYLIRRVFEAQMNTLPLLALLYVPVGLGIGYLYLWAQPDVVAADAKLKSQQFYFNEPFFVGRVVAYFVVWLAIGLLLSRWSVRQDRTGDPRYPWRFQRLGEIGLVLYGTTIHFAGFDWLESLQSSYHSTIFSLLVAASQILSGHAFAIVVLVLISLRTEVAAVASTRALNDLGNLLLAFVIIWSYMIWFQFMLNWIANMPTDALWYVERARGGWLIVTWVLFLGGLAVPLFLLLMRSVKSDPRRLSQVAGLIAIVQLVFSYYQVMPPFRANSIGEHWMDFLTPLAVGGIWLAYFLERLRRRPLLALNDPHREAALHLRHLDEEDAERELSIAYSQSEVG